MNLAKEQYPDLNLNAFKLKFYKKSQYNLKYILQFIFPNRGNASPNKKIVI